MSLPEPFAIDQFQPLGVERPDSVAGVGELVRRAAATGTGLYPVGGATLLHLGLPPLKPGHAVDLRALDQVVDYPARDMTITVGAGITIANLQRILAAENQRLPIDVPQPERATLGGAIAANVSGARRFGLGTLRDYVIGISFLTDGGHEAKAGGRVVKNVAGYDLCKLHTGALGTLGILTQVTLKLKPVPEDSRWVVCNASLAELPALLDRVHASQTRPVAVEVSPGRLSIGFEDNAESVAWQVEQCRQELARPDTRTLDGEAADAEWARLRELPPARLSLRANLLPSALPAFLAALTECPPSVWQAHAGNGIVAIHFDGDLMKSDAAVILQRLRPLAAAGGGSVIVTRCPAEWKRELDIWGLPRGDWALMRKIKHELDPRDLFNPGRFVV